MRHMCSTRDTKHRGAQTTHTACLTSDMGEAMSGVFRTRAMTRARDDTLAASPTQHEK